MDKLSQYNKPAYKSGEYSVGIDIGTTKIVVMIGRTNEYNKIEIVGIGKAKSIGVKRGVVNNIMHTINSIQQAASEAEANSGIDINDVVVGIAGQHIRSIQHSDYIIREQYEEFINYSDLNKLTNQVKSITLNPGEEIIHVLPQEYKIDDQSEIYDPIGMYGARLEANFHVVVGNIASIKNISRCINNSGFNLKDITLEPLASADSVLTQEEKEAGVVLVDIGGGTTDIAIFKEGIIRHTAVIPFGGNVITEDIKSGCSILERQAELLKIKYGSAWPGENKDNEVVTIPGLRGGRSKQISTKQLSRIINARVKEIMLQVLHEIKKYGYDEQKKKLIAGVVLTGGGSQLKHIRQLTEYVLGMDCRIGYPNEHLGSHQSNEDILTNPMYATAVGLVMKGLQEEMDLVSEETLAGRRSQNKKKTAQAEPKIKEFVEEVQEAPKDKQPGQRKMNFFEKWAEKFRENLNSTD